MEQKDKDIAYLLYEAMLARNERTIKKLIIALIISIVLIFASNAIWLYAWMQYDYVSEDSSVTVDADNGIANYIGNDGDINNGSDYSTETKENQN